jgi:hypothetical protein
MSLSWLIFRGKSLCSSALSVVLSDQEPDENTAGRQDRAAAGSPPTVTVGPPKGDGDAALGYGVREPSTPAARMILPQIGC